LHTLATKRKLNALLVDLASQSFKFHQKSQKFAT